jgi:hypothetical protein
LDHESLLRTLTLWWLHQFDKRSKSLPWPHEGPILGPWMPSHPVWYCSAASGAILIYPHLCKHSKPALCIGCFHTLCQLWLFRSLHVSVEMSLHRVLLILPSIRLTLSPRISDLLMPSWHLAHFQWLCFLSYFFSLS